MCYNFFIVLREGLLQEEQYEEFNETYNWSCHRNRGCSSCNALYRYFKPDYDDEFMDEFDDEFYDDDYEEDDSLFDEDDE